MNEMIQKKSIASVSIQMLLEINVLTPHKQTWSLFLTRAAPLGHQILN